MSLVGIKTRAKVVELLRQSLNSRGFEEIVPQLLDNAQPIEPTIYPFVTDNHQLLATSPEGYLKKAMAAGIGDCYAISHAFRNQEGKNNLHNPEFLMAEWYLKNADYLQIMNSINDVVGDILCLKNIWIKLSWLDLWKELPNLIEDKAMLIYAKSKGYNTDNATWEQLFYQIADNEIVSNFPKEPFFLVDFPTKISRLAKPQDKNPDFSERFELLINKIELADGNTEYFNEKAIRDLMLTEQAARFNKPPIDEVFLQAIKKLENKSWAGVGLGVDRLVMLYGNINSILEIQEP